MEINRYIMGPFYTNTYLLSVDNKAILIDPAGKVEKVIELLEDKELLCILLTHGHFDHIKAVDGLYEKYHCPIYLHKADEAMAKDKMSGDMFGIYNYISSNVTYLEEKEYSIGPFCFRVIFTPGHTEGSVIYDFNDCLFTGDTLFKCSVGRTDLVGGNNTKLKNSLKIFKTFNPETIIYPGHEDISTIGFELVNNPYLN